MVGAPGDEGRGKLSAELRVKSESAEDRRREKLRVLPWWSDPVSLSEILEESDTTTKTEYQIPGMLPVTREC